MFVSQAVPLRDMKNARDNMMGRKEWLKASEKTLQGATKGHRNRMTPCAPQLYTEYINRLLKAN